jgi:hypothetical protein
LLEPQAEDFLGAVGASVRAGHNKSDLDFIKIR